MWKFQDFAITQVLREINFEEFRSCKSAVFVILGALNFVHLVNFNFDKFKKCCFLQFFGAPNYVNLVNLAFKKCKN